MKELSLFSGTGGGLLATKHLLGWKTIGYVEIDEYCQAVLAQRIADGYLDFAPIFGDINQFIREGYAQGYQGMVDVITAGFPCQPFSVAGKRKGESDERNQWPNTIKCIRIIQPRFAFLENVSGLLNSGYAGRIFGDLAEAGYNARWCVLGADDVGAPHRRKRLWILAYTRDGRHRGDNKARLEDEVHNPTRWITPQARDYRTGERKRWNNPKKSRNLNDQVGNNQIQQRGQLNPDWVEWLMGWPIGWTDLKPLETDRFQQWLNSHGK